MEDEKFKSLFSDFQPDLSSDFGFMSELRHKLDAVEAIKQHTEELKTRNRKAVAIAALVGFVVGFLFSLSLPYLSDVIARWQLSKPEASLLYSMTGNFMVVVWTIIGATSVFAAVNAYEVSVVLLKPKEPTTY